MIHACAFQPFRQLQDCNHLVAQRGQRRKRRLRRKGTSNSGASATGYSSAATSSHIQKHLLTSLQKIDGVTDRKCAQAESSPPEYLLILAYYAPLAHI